jgi:hypothetical protein
MSRNRARAAALVALCSLCLPASVSAWGFEAHHDIAAAAIALLPPQLRPLFEEYRDVFVERVIDPDTWRTAGFDEEAKHHFLNLDWDGFGPDPYPGLPRDYDAAVAAFGLARIEEVGTVPWRAEEFSGRLRDAFARLDTLGARGHLPVVLFSAWLAHYVSDAHVPFHAVVNYDGQLTGQRGVHGRFESLLYERYRDRLDVDPETRAPIASPRDFIFDILTEGTRLAPTVLAADERARDGRPGYDDTYYAVFFGGAGPIMERRLTESVGAVAAVITGAWEAAGRPRP